MLSLLVMYHFTSLLGKYLLCFKSKWLAVNSEECYHWAGRNFDILLGCGHW